MLKEISFEIIRRCPNNCLHCSSYSTDKCTEIIPVELFKKVVKGAKRLGAQTISFSGGEPFLHPDIVEMIDFVHSLGLNSYLTAIVLKVSVNEFDYIKNSYLKIKAANSVLKSRMDKMLRFVKKEDEAYISTGSCRLCKPCKRKQNKPCAHPKEMTYSFEALGVDVSALTQKLFGITLLWYKDKVCPEYTCVVGGILSNRQIADKEILDVLNQLV